MLWSVTYSIWYPDFNRPGITKCDDRKQAFANARAAMANRDFLTIAINRGPLTVASWTRDNERTNPLRRVWK